MMMPIKVPTEENFWSAHSRDNKGESPARASLHHANEEAIIAAKSTDDQGHGRNSSEELQVAAINAFNLLHDSMAKVKLNSTPSMDDFYDSNSFTDVDISATAIASRLAVKATAETMVADDEVGGPFANGARVTAPINPTIPSTPGSLNDFQDSISDPEIPPAQFDISENFLNNADLSQQGNLVEEAVAEQSLLSQKDVFGEAVLSSASDQPEEVSLDTLTNSACPENICDSIGESGGDQQVGSDYSGAVSVEKDSPIATDPAPEEFITTPELDRRPSSDQVLPSINHDVGTIINESPGANPEPKHEGEDEEDFDDFVQAPPIDTATVVQPPFSTTNDPDEILALLRKELGIDSNQGEPTIFPPVKELRRRFEQDFTPLYPIYNSINREIDSLNTEKSVEILRQVFLKHQNE